MQNKQEWGCDYKTERFINIGENVAKRMPKCLFWRKSQHTLSTHEPMFFFLMVNDMSTGFAKLFAIILENSSKVRIRFKTVELRGTT